MAQLVAGAVPDTMYLWYNAERGRIDAYFTNTAQKLQVAVCFEVWFPTVNGEPDVQLKGFPCRAMQ